jgi:hypothetical protein
VGESEGLEWTHGVRHKVKGVIAVRCKSIGGEAAVDPLWKYLSGGKGNAGMRPERRLSGRNDRGGGLTVSPSADGRHSGWP